MGRHRSTLRDLGWGAANSPNPWKHGSAKRVVRALDYGNIEVEPPKLAAEEVVAPEAPSCDQQIREETIGDFLGRAFRLVTQTSLGSAPRLL